MGPTRPGGSAATSSTKKVSSFIGKSEGAGRQQASLHEYLKKSKIFPQQKQKQPQQVKQKEKQKEKEEEQKPKPSGNKILDGVVACIDVRTEDGDDVSQNFERALQSMGAKTRRTFSDSVTHLIFKNGSTATLKKALSKGVFIMNLLWISKCKKEGRRLDEKDYIIEKPQGLVLTGTKRRKSMEPGKVRALALNGQDPDLLEPSVSTSSSEGSSHEENNILPSGRRRATLDLAERKRLSMAEREVKRRKLQEELEGYEEDEEVGQAKTPRLSLPLNVESLANRHNQQQQNKLIIPIHAPSAEMKEQIKARFSIGQIEESTNQLPSKPSPVASRLSLSSTPSASPIKRKRRLTGSLLKPSPSISPSISGSSNNIKNESIPIMISPLPTPEPTIVFTSMAPALRKQCMEVINRLGKLEIASNVDDRTTHILCGTDRRTKSVVLGLLRGAWVIKPKWILESKTEYKQEQEYEIKEWALAEKRRQTKLIFPDLVVKVELGQAEADAVKEIIEVANGICLTENDEDASLFISSNRRAAEPGKTVVSSHWLYDSVGQWKVLPTDKYAISKK